MSLAQPPAAQLTDEERAILDRVCDTFTRMFEFKRSHPAMAPAIDAAIAQLCGALDAVGPA